MTCHPGYSDKELEAMGSYSTIREQELAVLQEPTISSEVEKNNAKPVTFWALEM